MHLFASHFGCYEVRSHATGPELVPFRHDPNPSALGQHYLELAQDPARLSRPMARKGWLAGDKGAARGNDSFVELTYDQALDLAAETVRSVRATHGSDAIFAGSYGWASAGRLHNPQTLLKRFLKLTGGFTSSRHTYSFGTAEVLLPRLVGSGFTDPAELAPHWDQIVAAKPFLISFGGMRMANAQVGAGGVGLHMTQHWLQRFADAGGEMLTLSPDARDAPFGQHQAINAGTDTFVLLALAYVLMEQNQHAEEFLNSRCSGWPDIRKLLSGDSDGVPKTPEWAADISGIPADVLRDIASRLGSQPNLINISWSLQRAYAGEQPYWAAIVLAAMCGHIGKPGLGVACGLAATAGIGMPRRKLKMPVWDHTVNPIDSFIPVARITDMLENPGGSFSYDGQDMRVPNARLVWWAGGNPFHHHQDLNRLATAWRSPETVIVNECMRTATVDHADLVFPATLPFERNEIVAARRDDWLVLSKQVQAPPDGCINDFECFAQMADRFGAKDQFTEGLDEWGWLERIYASYRNAFSELPEWQDFTAAGHARRPAAKDRTDATPLMSFVQSPTDTRLDTATGRIDLAPAAIFDHDAQLGHPLCAPVTADHGEDSAFPLRLLTPQPETRLHSQLEMATPAQNAKVNGYECARMNPADITEMGLQSGALAEIWNKRGIILVALVADGQVASGHVVLPTGAWYRPIIDTAGRRVDLGGNPNTLTRDQGTSSLSQGASAGVSRVGVRRISPSLSQIVN